MKVSGVQHRDPTLLYITQCLPRVLPTPYYPAEKHRGEEQGEHSTEERTVDWKSESLSFSPTTCLCSGLRLLSCRVTSPLRGWRNKKNGRASMSLEASMARCDYHLSIPIFHY
ncbi:uncharacterized protein LOC122198757 isoform X8 [Panthera leo]|uniref:uncharacterized protein LOC122198757 isoform X8 n=1 Tax=Panthera leo TaxID=9689 RepID=UPI001C69FB32|nr:uncharacterized protein LOC122198757 isoform X8 [Panthera leo]